MSNFKNNLSAIRRDARKVPELLRTAFGVVVRPLQTQSPIDPHFKSYSQRPYREHETLVPIRVATPKGGHYMHTFFDIDPISPSGRYLAVTQVPFLWRIPYPGDKADICVIDLHTSQHRTVYRTGCWGTQIGANVQWGADDDTIFCNDIAEGRGTGIEISLTRDKARVLDGPIYGLTADKRFSFSGSLELVNQAQTGYGAPETLFNQPSLTDVASSTEGLWRTDLVSGKRELFLSIKEIVEQLPDQEKVTGGTYYIYNVKVNRQGTRILIAIFSKNIPGRFGWPMQLVTCRTDGTDIKLAVSDAVWRKGGHHANWHPDGEHIIMNLKIDGEMRFTKFRADGSGLEILTTHLRGGGHPSGDAKDRWLVTDAYASEGLADARGEIPIRLVDMQSEIETELCRLNTKNLAGGRRIDPHPVWSNDDRQIVFNALVEGERQVLIADVTSLKAGHKNG